ncbi:unnamed protein product [Owenia fusiformis]|uniref:Uncharacterized protein n=1 Tax=Owenia fusiformis TaxID=6347 RepID=A0A8J1XZ11_OWEFU|nr:unnamed protein product [Owenia fusiformis]
MAYQQGSKWDVAFESLKHELANTKKGDKLQMANVVLSAMPSNQAHIGHEGISLTREKNRMNRKLHKKRTSNDGLNSSMNSSKGLTKRNQVALDVELQSFQEDDFDKVIYEEDETETERIVQSKILMIKQMPASIYVKRQVRAKLLSVPTVPLTGCAAWRVQQRASWRRTKNAYNDLMSRLELWRRSFKTIEGHFGAGVVSYFTFLKWLFFLNIYIMLLFGVFIVLPQVVFPSVDYNSNVTGNGTSVNLSATMVCSANYNVTVDPTNYQQLILDFLQGTGWMEKTVLFYGIYDNTELNIGTFEGLTYNYNMPLAYLCVTITYLVLSLILMVRHTGNSLKDSLVTDEDRFYSYSNKVFGGWDFSMEDPYAAGLKKKSLYNEITGDLQEEREASRRRQRRGWKACGIFTLRVFINIIVLAILGGSGYLIYYATQVSLEFSKSALYSQYSTLVQLLMEFLPSLTITFLNIIVPSIFQKIIRAEDYTPMIDIKLTLVRTVFLRLASLATLIATLYIQITCLPKDSCGVNTDACTPLQCWETYVGQQLYKLVIMDFIITIGVIFFVEFPRKLFVTKCSCKACKMIGQQKFMIPKHVLDLVYSQALCWLGAFYAPLIPAVCVLKFFILFYVKKLTVLVNYEPSGRPYRASKSNSFFMIVLLSSFFLVCIPIAYSIAQLAPSKGCGPFRIYYYMHEIMSITIATWPAALQSIFNFITSAGFAIPLFIVLGLVVYYYSTMSSANKEMVAILREQLILEGKDKQFLLGRINELSGDKKTGKNKEKKKLEATMSVADESIPEKPDGSLGMLRQRTGHSVAPSDVELERHVNTPPGVPY